MEPVGDDLEELKTIFRQALEEQDYLIVFVG
jgi:hypothetical protein